MFYMKVTNDPLRFSVQREGVSRTGERTIDTFLDQIVFGLPVTSFDLWQKSKLNETSRRTNNQCGIDVIVASAQSRTTRRADGKPMLTAGKAAQQLMSLAKQHFPDSALAKCDAWHEPATNLRDTKAANVLAELRNRDYGIDELEPYISKMQEFLKKSKTLDQIKESLGKGNIYRKTKQETLPPISLSKAMATHITWTTDHEHRLLIFLCAFPEHFAPLPNDSFIAKAQSKVPTESCVDQQLAQEAILKHGTPVRLLYLLFENWGFAS